MKQKIYRNSKLEHLIRCVKIGDRIEGIKRKDIPILLQTLRKQNNTIYFSTYQIGKIICLTVFGIC